MEEQTAKMPYTPMKNQNKSEHEIRKDVSQQLAKISATLNNKKIKNLEEAGDADLKKKNSPVALYKDKIVKAKKRSILRHV